MKHVRSHHFSAQMAPYFPHSEKLKSSQWSIRPYMIWLSNPSQTSFPITIPPHSTPTSSLFLNHVHHAPTCILLLTHHVYCFNSPLEFLKEKKKSSGGTEFLQFSSRVLSPSPEITPAHSAV